MTSSPTGFQTGMKTLTALTTSDLRFLASAQGPCITIHLPDHQPGASGPARNVLLRQLTHTAKERLRDFERLPGADRIPALLDAMVEAGQFQNGGPGLALFCAPGVASVFLTPGVSPFVAVGERFALLPVIAQGGIPADAYALGVNRNHVRLWRVHLFDAEELPLPAAVPASLREAGAFDAPDHDLENRSSAGPSVGGSRVRFGTSADRGEAYLREFFTLISRGLHDTVRDAPLFLIGVREDLAEYRRADALHSILETEWHEAAEYCSDSDVAAHAREACVQRYRAHADALVRTLVEEKTSIKGDVHAIIAAAKAGRVHRLLVAEAAEPDGPVNMAAVEALCTGGEVVAFQGSDVPDLGALGALLRY